MKYDHSGIFKDLYNRSSFLSSTISLQTNFTKYIPGNGLLTRSRVKHGSDREKILYESEEP